MQNPVDNYWKLRLADLKATLEGNNFEAYIADTGEEAADLVRDVLIPGLGARTVAYGGSMTVVATGLYDALKTSAALEIIDTMDRSVSAAESLERRRQALLADLFITGTNAVTEEGQLVNLDMIGNRVAGITFGPKHVIILVGRNKVVPELEEAMVRIKDFAAPANAMRLDKKTPCVRTSVCEECKSPERICNHWTITEKSYPKGRIKVVLINADLGL
jgi:L-lactate utilization protein LutB